MLLSERAIFDEFVPAYFSHQFWDSDFFLLTSLIVLSVIVIICLMLQILLFLE